MRYNKKHPKFLSGKPERGPEDIPSSPTAATIAGRLSRPRTPTRCSCPALSLAGPRKVQKHRNVLDTPMDMNGDQCTRVQKVLDSPPVYGDASGLSKAWWEEQVRISRQQLQASRRLLEKHDDLVLEARQSINGHHSCGPRVANKKETLERRRALCQKQRELETRLDYCLDRLRMEEPNLRRIANRIRATQDEAWKGKPVAFLDRSLKPGEPPALDDAASQGVIG